MEGLKSSAKNMNSVSFQRLKFIPEIKKYKNANVIKSTPDITFKNPRIIKITLIAFTVFPLKPALLLFYLNPQKDEPLLSYISVKDG